MPVCARCFGALLGQMLSLLEPHFVKLEWGILLLLSFPMLLDWCLQEYAGVLSNNLRRCVTGILCGYALGSLYLRLLLMGLQLIH